MHGQPKGTRVFAQNRVSGDLDKVPFQTSELIYHYELVDETRPGFQAGGKVKKLINDVDVIDFSMPSTPWVVEEDAYEIGVTREVIKDRRGTFNKSLSIQANINLDIFVVAVAVIPIATLFPNVTNNVTEMDYAVTNTIINRSGILKSVKNTLYNQKTELVNEYYNKETGDVAVTSTNTGTYAVSESGKEEIRQYSITIPAYDNFPGMGMASKEVGLGNFKIEVTNGKMIVNSSTNKALQHLFPGAVVLVKENGSEERQMLLFKGIKSVNNVESADFKEISASLDTKLTSEFLTDISGKYGYNTLEAKVIHPGRKNMLTSQATVLTTLIDPKNTAQAISTTNQSVANSNDVITRSNR
jgi:hypothetical protein